MIRLAASKWASDLASALSPHSRLLATLASSLSRRVTSCSPFPAEDSLVRSGLLRSGDRTAEDQPNVLLAPAPAFLRRDPAFGQVGGDLLQGLSGTTHSVNTLRDSHLLGVLRQLAVAAAGVPEGDSAEGHSLRPEGTQGGAGPLDGEEPLDLSDHRHHGAGDVADP